MDRQLPKDIILKQRRKRWIVGISIFISFLLIIFIIRQFSTRSVEWARIRYSVAESGDIEATLNASGTIVPEIEQAITAPNNSILRKCLLRPGDNVKAGQSILELEKDNLQIEYDKTKEQLELLRYKRTQMGLELERKQAELQASKEVKELQARFVRIQYDRIKRLNEIGASSEEELQRAALASEIADRELAVLNLQIDNQRASMETDLQSLLLQVHLQEKTLNEISRRLALSNAPSTLDGIVTWVNDSIGFPIREGDVVARVADLSRYRLQGEISSINSGLIAVGQIVRIRIGEKIIDGKISSISPLVRNSLTSFDVQLDNPNDEILRPNLRTDVFVVTSSVNNVVRVSNGPFYEGLHDQTIFVINGNRAQSRKVDIGAANFNWVEVQGGISPGDTVIVSDMKKYREAKLLTIKNRKDAISQNR
ncbi:MAG: HlyD family efflux transporter periplasmic adaptor subunit [candidate division Zixibacteria bacterium]|nr:HlyD family efflux transporter periplasmic adaptor subunit [candidate division Zixibacteria bacterium]